MPKWCACTSRIGWCPSWLTGFPLGAVITHQLESFCAESRGTPTRDKDSRSFLSAGCGCWASLSMESYVWLAGVLSVNYSRDPAQNCQVWQTTLVVIYALWPDWLCSSLFSLVKDKLASVSCSNIEDVSILTRFPKIGYISCVHLFFYTSPIFICFL